MIPIVDAKQMHAYEQRLFEFLPSILLMEHAALAAADEICKRHPPCKALIVAGPGNNGGDGLAIARILAQRGYAPHILLAARELKHDSLINFGIAKAYGLPFVDVTRDLPMDFGLVVDALFGTGLDRGLGNYFLELISLVNKYPAPVYSVDMPSGVCANTGEIFGESVKADVTITFQFPKFGQLLFPGRERCGELIIAPIAPQGFINDVSCEFIERSDLPRAFKARKPDCYKGDFGKALLLGGSQGYSGAVIMAARAALKTGTGLLSLGVPSAVAPAVWSSLPEAMVHALTQKSITSLLAGKTCVGAGPGWLGADQSVLRAVLESGLPCVLDAHALNMLSTDASLLALLHGNVILTPHFGEMGLLTGESVEYVNLHQAEIAADFAGRHSCIVCLKGATSVIADGNRVTINTAGNTALAKGGSGDALCGMILALLAQGNSAYDAARFGSLLLGLCAQTLTMPPQCAMTGDIIEAIPGAIAGAISE